MPNYGEMLLSKVLDERNARVLTQYAVEERHFPTDAERRAYRFIVEYAESNRGQVPDYRTVVAEVDGFTYVPGVEDSFEYLVTKLKNLSAKIEVKRLLEEEATEKFEKLSGIEFAEWLKDKLDGVIMGTHVRKKVGTDIKRDTDRFIAEYKRRKEGKSFRIWKSKFPSINREVGGYLAGNIYTWYGRSGRGKSVFVMEEAIEAAMQGATVLVWALEMSRFEWLVRAYSSISARHGLLTTTIDGVDYESGFDSRAMLTGRLSAEYERGLETFLSTLDEILPGTIILRAVDDEDFTGRKIRDLEADIIATKSDVVVIDPFYYLDYEANTSKTAGGDAAHTSKKIRHLAGLTNTVIHVVTQADEVKDSRGEDGVRELKPPQRAEIKKTKAVLEDATNVFGIDTSDGQGVIEIGKGRHGGEGVRVEVRYLPQFGIVDEIEANAEQFDVTSVF